MEYYALVLKGRLATKRLMEVTKRTTRTIDSQTGRRNYMHKVFSILCFLVHILLYYVAILKDRKKLL